jgi:organic anion transporter 5A
MDRGARKFRWSHLHIVIVLCSAQFIHSLVLNGTMNVIISSLQKEFYLKSKDTGMYISLYDVGSLMAAIFVPIMGTRGSKPRWIAFGMFMLFVGCMVNVAPHFLKSRPSNMTVTINGSLDDAHDDSQSGLCTSFSTEPAHQPNASAIADNADDVLSNWCTKKNSMTAVHLTYLKYILFVSSVLCGLSSASVTTLAYSYIEDISPKNSATVYESIYIAADTLGMGVCSEPLRLAVFDLKREFVNFKASDSCSPVSF